MMDVGLFRESNQDVYIKQIFQLTQKSSSSKAAFTISLVMTLPRAGSISKPLGARTRFGEGEPEGGADAPFRANSPMAAPSVTPRPFA